jgi:hypothetical protein
MSSSSGILSAFNEHFIEFIEDIQNIFPNDQTLTTAKNSLLAIKRANPKMLIKIFKTFVVGKYKKEIQEGDIDFFINKDYSQEIKSEGADVILAAIDKFREPIKLLKNEDKEKTLKYIQNLLKLSELYDNN